jgi:HK97 family phage major capsid protein
MPVKTRENIAAEYNAAVERMQAAADVLERAEDVTQEMRDEFSSACDAADELRELHDERVALEASRSKHKPLPTSTGGSTVDATRDDGRPSLEERTAAARIKITEPDLYTKRNGRFLTDLYLRDVKNDYGASERIGKHQAFEEERWYGDLGVHERAIATGTLGGVIPPQYLVAAYAKAGRNGRVYADQANKQDLPDQGMSVIIPRLTVGLAAGVQTAESATVTTGDPTEVDLTVPVRTIAGYSPVSRQTLERAAYSEPILMEDLIARYNQTLDVQALNGSGSSGQMLGVLGTSGISTSTCSTATVIALWPKIADLIQQIATAVGGIGIVADKIIMHPRRWGAITAALDSSNRPLFPVGQGPQSVNTLAQGGTASVYGYTGSTIQGLPVYTDANIPTNLGAGTNEDRVIVQASDAVMLWERPDDPVTLAFEQTAATALQVQLIAYGYAAFTAGRYPAASGVISGVGLVPPTF